MSRSAALVATYVEFEDLGDLGLHLREFVHELVWAHALAKLATVTVLAKAARPAVECLVASARFASTCTARSFFDAPGARAGKGAWLHRNAHWRRVLH